MCYIKSMGERCSEALRNVRQRVKGRQEMEKHNDKYLCEQCNNAFRFATQQGKRTVVWRYCTNDGTCIETSVAAQVFKCRSYMPGRPTKVTEAQA